MHADPGPELIDLLQQKEAFFWQSCTIGEAEQVEAFVRAAAEWAAADGLYGLVNNAGIAMSGILATFPVVDIERILKVNLLGPLQAARAVAQQFLRTNRGGRIINISSIIGTARLQWPFRLQRLEGGARRPDAGSARAGPRETSRSTRSPPGISARRCPRR